ncbi:hypothetical protein [Fulvivirga ligni]|uniref:hypothetical protein n=1 Tax=Fulvivirga ligni TaxID=2904246 RepID=UPI001F48402D|nr:hypothetical protein [Fulvivirga ligni]UII21599.1 hypothetical protein LVD16_27610 [Fulvivirga ligni]
MYRGSVAKNGKIGSARDFGNMGAGIVAARNNLSWTIARLGYDGLESYQQRRLSTEGKTTQKAERVGFNMGIDSRKNDLNKKGSVRMRVRQRDHPIKK